MGSILPEDHPRAARLYEGIPQGSNAPQECCHWWLWCGRVRAYGDQRTSRPTTRTLCVHHALLKRKKALHTDDDVTRGPVNESDDVCCCCSSRLYNSSFVVFVFFLHFVFLLVPLFLYMCHLRINNKLRKLFCEKNNDCFFCLSLCACACMRL